MDKFTGEEFEQKSRCCAGPVEQGNNIAKALLACQRVRIEDFGSRSEVVDRSAIKNEQSLRSLVARMQAAQKVIFEFEDGSYYGLTLPGNPQGSESLTAFHEWGVIGEDVLQ